MIIFYKSILIFSIFLSACNLKKSECAIASRTDIIELSHGEKISLQQLSPYPTKYTFIGNCKVSNLVLEKCHSEGNSNIIEEELSSIENYLNGKHLKKEFLQNECVSVHIEIENG